MVKSSIISNNDVFGGGSIDFDIDDKISTIDYQKY